MDDQLPPEDVTPELTNPPLLDDDFADIEPPDAPPPPGDLLPPTAPPDAPFTPDGVPVATFETELAGSVTVPDEPPMPPIGDVDTTTVPPPAGTDDGATFEEPVAPGPLGEGDPGSVVAPGQPGSEPSEPSEAMTTTPPMPPVEGDTDLAPPPPAGADGDAGAPPPPPPGTGDEPGNVIGVPPSADQPAGDPPMPPVGGDEPAGEPPMPPIGGDQPAGEPPMPPVGGDEPAGEPPMPPGLGPAGPAPEEPAPVVGGEPPVDGEPAGDLPGTAPIAPSEPVPLPPDLVGALGELFAGAGVDVDVDVPVDVDVDISELVTLLDAQDVPTAVATGSIDDLATHVAAGTPVVVSTVDGAGIATPSRITSIDQAGGSVQLTPLAGGDPATFALSDLLDRWGEAFGEMFVALDEPAGDAGTLPALDGDVSLFESLRIGIVEAAKFVLLPVRMVVEAVRT